MATHFVNGVKLKIVPASEGGGVLWAGWQCRRSIGISRLRKRDRLSAGWIELVTWAKEKRLQRGREGRERERVWCLTRPSNTDKPFPFPFQWLAPRSTIVFSRCCESDVRGFSMCCDVLWFREKYKRKRSRRRIHVPFSRIQVKFIQTLWHWCIIYKLILSQNLISPPLLHPAHGEYLRNPFVFVWTNGYQALILVLLIVANRNQGKPAASFIYRTVLEEKVTPFPPFIFLVSFASPLPPVLEEEEPGRKVGGGGGGWERRRNRIRSAIGGEGNSVFLPEKREAIKEEEEKVGGGARSARMDIIPPGVLFIRGGGRNWWSSTPGTHLPRPRQRSRPPVIFHPFRRENFIYGMPSRPTTFFKLIYCPTTVKRTVVWTLIG